MDTDNSNIYNNSSSSEIASSSSVIQINNLKEEATSANNSKEISMENINETTGRNNISIYGYKFFFSFSSSLNKY